MVPNGHSPPFHLQRGARVVGFFQTLGTASVFYVLSLAPVTVVADTPQFEGYKVCVKCHDTHEKPWRDTVHAKAFTSLEARSKREAKLKARLDPDKDYSADPECLGCHTTGYGEPGGYADDLPKARAKRLVGVGCESCHGAGSLYRETHSDAEHRLKLAAESTDRSALVAAGQNFDFAEACARCHLNYEGSPWKGAKAPFTPFTPEIDAKYAFDFETAIRSEAMHTHFKLYDVFKGEPVPPFREEFQDTAEEIE